MPTLDDVLANRTHGATRLLADTLDALETLLVTGKPVPDDVVDRLIAAHPGMACFHALRDRFPQGCSIRKLQEIRSEMAVHTRDVVAAFRHRLPTDATRLAVFSHSSMVAAAVGALPVRMLTVSCALSWPEGEGAVMAEALAKAGVGEVRLLPDGAFFSRLADHDVLVLGCDAYSDTRFINKAGTAAAVRLALDAGLPVFVVPGPFRSVSEAVMDGLPLKSIPFPDPGPGHPAVHASCPLLERVSRQGVQLLEPEPGRGQSSVN